ncbi:MAG: hypothetical protein AB7G93_19700 [Bdellovibrionales bacterium]
MKKQAVVLVLILTGLVPIWGWGKTDIPAGTTQEEASTEANSFDVINCTRPECNRTNPEGDFANPRRGREDVMRMADTHLDPERSSSPVPPKPGDGKAVPEGK